MKSTVQPPTNIKNIPTYLRDFFAGIRPVWPFFALLTLAMTILYTMTVANKPEIHHPWMLVLFTFLMLLHTSLHWLSPLAAATNTRSTVYLLVQLALMLGMVFMTRYETLSMGLFMGMVGEMLGVVRPLKRSLLAVLLLIATVFVLHGYLFGWQNSSLFFITLLPLTFFVVIYVYLFTRQLEEKQRAEKLLIELEGTHQQLRAYSDQIETLTLNNERQRMARELHDTLSQGLAGVILQLEAAGQHLEKGNHEKAGAIIKQAGSRARSTLAEARQVIDDLRSSTPADLSLKSFVTERAEHFTSLTGLPCKVTMDDTLPVDEATAQQIEKLISEGLTNILRHARAQQSWITLNCEGDQLNLEIGDDGHGFEVEKTTAGSGHYGLVGMRERTRMNHGSFRIESAPGQGTRLIFTFPLHNESGEQL